MQPDIFHDRLQAVRERFACSLTGKIQDTRSQLANLSGGADGVVDAVAATYRLIHGICGIGAAVGFASTGRAAKDVEDVLVGAYREQRGLAADELVRLVARLDALSAAAEAELGSPATREMNCAAAPGGMQGKEHEASRQEIEASNGGVDAFPGCR